MSASPVVRRVSPSQHMHVYAGHDVTCMQLLKRIPDCAGLMTHAELYPSTGFHDELAWAAAWLYKATGDGAPT